jgi:hypothetical protein
MENKMSQTMQAELKETLSPQAVAVNIAHLQCCDVNATVHREVAWFRKAQTTVQKKMKKVVASA